MNRQYKKQILMNLVMGIACGFTVAACTSIPEPRKFDVPELQSPEKPTAFNRTTDAVIYAPLGPDVLRPHAVDETDKLPGDKVGPLEMRNETLASALQFVLEDYKIPLAIETDKAMEKTVTVSNLKGTLQRVVEKMCSLAELYCAYEDGMMVVKENETFTVPLPPLGSEAFEEFAKGVNAITGTTGVIDNTTRSLIYTANQKVHERVMRYFDRLRNNTALIVFETHVWEVLLNNQNQRGIDWTTFTFNLGKIGTVLTRNGAPSIEGALGIGAQYTSSDLSFDGVFDFLATQGAVKTVSQPQITVLSGSSASMEVGNSRDYISEITRSTGVDSEDSISVTTDTLETGLILKIDSAWDNSTVYGNLDIELRELVNLLEQEISGTNIQLPETSKRNLVTRIRVRPGDALLIGGIVIERDSAANTGLGFMNPIIPTSSDTQSKNSELVIMMRPRVVVYTDNVPENTEPLSDDKADRNTYREKREPGDSDIIAEDDSPLNDPVEVESINGSEDEVLSAADEDYPQPVKKSSVSKNKGKSSGKKQVKAKEDEKPESDIDTGLTKDADGTIIIQGKDPAIKGEYIYQAPIDGGLPAFEPTPLIKEDLTEFTPKVQPKRRVGQSSELDEVNKSMKNSGNSSFSSMSGYIDNVVNSDIEP